MKVADGSASRDDILSTGSVSHTLSRDYFLFLGQLTTSSTGMEILRKLSTFSWLETWIMSLWSVGNS